MGEFTFSQLSPTSFLTRSGDVFGDKVAIIDGDRHYTYAEFRERARRLAGALMKLGVMPGDRVAALCVNSHVMLELHNGVAWAGAVLVPLNIRLSASELAFIVRHSGATVVVASSELSAKAVAAIEGTEIVLVIAGGETDDYEALVQAAEPRSMPCIDERDLLAINYTSGTTGFPKGVMYHHRGAYLQSLAVAFHSRLTTDSRYLWTLPMFHCNGWCSTWAVTAAGGTHLCLHATDPAEIWRLVRQEAVTHYSAAPTVLTMIVNAEEARNGALPERPIRVGTGGSPPSPTLLEALSALRMDVTHMYGLTETFGPFVINEWRAEWDSLDEREQARLRARQGVGNIIADRLRVVDEAGRDVRADGQTIGELVCRGNDVMLGYYRDDDATRAATMDGWLRTGDLGVMYPDGYVEIRDRSKDIIISGGENIASIEVEQVLDSHAEVLESAVVGEPDQQWGEVPVAFVSLHPDGAVTAEELIQFARSRLAHFKAPKRVIFGELPKTSTGKIPKTELRRRLRAVEESD